MGEFSVKYILVHTMEDKGELGEKWGLYLCIVIGKESDKGYAGKGPRSVPIVVITDRTSINH